MTLENAALPVRPVADRPLRRLATAPRRVLAVLTVLGGVVYSMWVVEWWLDPRLDPWRSYVSELSARDQPAGGLYTVGDLTSAALITLGAAIALVALPRPRWAVTGWALQLGFGLVSIADAWFRLDCAPSGSTSCALHERAGFVSADHKNHAVTSTLAIFLVIGSIAALLVAARRYGWGREAWRVGIPLLAIQVVTSILTLVFAVGGSYEGISERIQVGGVSAWLVLLGWLLWQETGMWRAEP